MKNTEFYKRLKNLNENQLTAVNHIDGPLLVLAGPGTGKTELLSMRVANILIETDTLPENILCLTFTEAATLNMKERLSSIIGIQSNDVNINTYHSFASEIIRNYPDFFAEVNLETGKDYILEKPIDEITQNEIIISIQQKLPYTNKLKSLRFTKDIISTISDLKQANLSSNKLDEILTSNKLTVDEFKNKNKIFIDRMPPKSKAISLFSEIKDTLDEINTEYANLATNELEIAIDTAIQTNKTTSLTKWKNKWLERDRNNNLTLKGETIILKLIDLNDIYKEYQNELKQTDQYDFNDMIIKTIEALRDNSELLFNVQEKYQYILLDEFQDTNHAQFELIRLISDSPVNEGRPNIMAVGDDDQGIFAFQGANIGNMKSFYSSFTDVELVNLTSNYRSHPEIIHVAHELGNQIEYRLHHDMDGISKKLISSGNNLPADSTIERHEFKTELNEHYWISEKIDYLIKNNVKPSEICIISPKHKILENIVPYLVKNNISISYEKQDNIINSRLIQSIYLIFKFIKSYQIHDYDSINELIPKILSFEYWNINPEILWKVNWKFYSEKKNNKSWIELAKNLEDCQSAIRFLEFLAITSDSIDLDNLMAYTIGSKPLPTSDNIISPISEYFLSGETIIQNPQLFYESISELKVILDNIKAKQTSSRVLTVDDFINLIDSYTSSGKSLLNSYTIEQSKDSVQLMTVFKAKGLEFEYVFLPWMNDDVWGSSSKNNSNSISLPENLKYIKHLAEDEDTKKRLLFVATSRAKHGLIVTNHLYKENGKQNSPVKFFQESEQDGVKSSKILPKDKNVIIENTFSREETLTQIKDSWKNRNLKIDLSLKNIIYNRLKNYVISPTHINNFIDLENCGPEKFLISNILNFPEAQSISSMYGSLAHKFLENIQKGIDFDKCISELESQVNYSYLNERDKKDLIIRAKNSLTDYYDRNKNWLHSDSLVEVDFQNENIYYKKAKLKGKIDRLEIDKDSKTALIYDFKTGKLIPKWLTDVKSIKYKQQLYFYKYLVENSKTYKDYKVNKLSLEFIESSDYNFSRLDLNFNETEYQNFLLLLEIIWNKIINLDIPDTTKYQKTSSGTNKFIKDLMDRKI